MTETVEQLKHRARELRQSPYLTNEHLNALNDLAWQMRRIDEPLVAELSAEALQLSARNDYRRGRAFALSNLAQCQMRTESISRSRTGL